MWLVLDIEVSELRRQAAHRAYARLERFRELDPAYPKAVDALDRLRLAIAAWDGIDPQFFAAHVMGSSADAVSSSTTTSGPMPTFLKIWNDEGGRERIVKLLKLRQREPKGTVRTMRKVTEIGLREYINRGFTPKPVALTNRLISMLFPDLFTTIANESDLKATAHDLGRNFEGDLPLANMQFQVREAVLAALGADHPIHEAHVYDRASLAVWVRKPYQD